MTNNAPGDINKGPGIALSTIVATYNARDAVVSCIQSILAHPPSVPHEIIVVDDGSTDHTHELVKSRFPQVRLIRNDVNLHYARSVNRALAEARGRYIYLLNNDTLMRPGTFDAMLAFLDENPKVGAVGSRLLNEDGTVQPSAKPFPNAMAAIFGARSPITHFFPNNSMSRKQLLHVSKDMTAPSTADMVSGASVMMPREVIETVGGLDEHFFYHVDADHCKRIKDAGWDIYYLPTATVVHLNHKGGSLAGKRRRFLSNCEFHLHSYRYYRKYMMRSRWEPMHFLVAAGLGGRFLVSLLLNAAKEVASECRALVNSSQPSVRRNSGSGE